MEQDNKQKSLEEEIVEQGNKQTQDNRGSKKLVFGIVGFLLGAPMSYFFQPPIIREKISFGRYVEHLPEILSGPNSWKTDPMLGSNPSLTVLVTCVICAAIFGFMGYLIDKANKPNA